MKALNLREICPIQVSLSFYNSKTNNILDFMKKSTTKVIQNKKGIEFTPLVNTNNENKEEIKEVAASKSMKRKNKHYELPQQEYEGGEPSLDWLVFYY